MRPSDAALAAALREAGLHDMAARAEQSHYNDFFSPLATPIMDLAEELRVVGTKESLALRQRVIMGEFDASEEESDEWAKSSEGQATFARLAKPDK